MALDALLTLGIATSLAFAAVFNVLIPSLAGVLNTLSLSDGIWSFADSYLPSRLDSGPNALSAALIMFVSAEVSIRISRYQIRVGTATGHASVVADGEETRSDGKIEALAGTGLLLQLATGLGWLEYLFGLAMAYVMLRTAYEIFESGRDALFSRSLGDSVEDGIRSVVDATPGIECLRSILTYRRGNCRVADVEVQSPLGSQPRGHIERYISEQIRRILEESGDGGREIAVNVRAVPPDEVQTRWGYLARIESGVLRVIGDPCVATHLVVCDVVNGAIKSYHNVPVDADSLAGVITKKRVAIVHVFQECSGDWTYGQAEVRLVPSGDPRLLGIPLE
ncbi:hypothetical protein A2348_02075 [Candidatus Uhrbacteria bacterium RIFOXYB12_FULL_58_10]|uniref:Uncharacterized protein n=1 Tax=Candidatus Uhrbacteria bacterium RIFOXYB2_FULL_57_15 TaxID=1802422 RepID=A0A1F7W8Y7_9BACT|nr:MAG: hypothetical protein A2348_02075 [Candidatus Uhrbacteria bacterium RIFOXYB12_FULL_58_10]OGL98554.1 MAG: hypothetical protein A2304_04265 [Candidatus Uhrbacteria bacterium RIFOXYB2_FULL_57_15]